MNLKIVKQKVEERKYPGGIKRLAKIVGMTEQNMHRCLRENKIQLHHLENIARELDIPMSEFFNEAPVKKEIHTEGDYSPASESGNVSVVVGDASLAVKVESLERTIAEKNIIIDEMRERINELREHISVLKKILKKLRGQGV